MPTMLPASTSDRPRSRESQSVTVYSSENIASISRNFAK